MRSVPPGNTSLSRRTLSGSFGRLGTSTSRPKPLKTPLATTVLSTVREPDVPDATILALNDSWPEVRAGPDAAAAAAGRTSPTTTAVQGVRRLRPSSHLRSWWDGTASPAGAAHPGQRPRPRRRYARRERDASTPAQA